ncbi:MAG TPA: S1 family peptidase [Solirubrobacterales bacterium]|nr:S1 family peptidase [Solirubrobacterales bacterium]
MAVMMAFVVLAATTPEATAKVTPAEAAAYQDQFGVSRSVASERLEVQTRGSKAHIGAVLEERLRNDFGGLWFDNETGEYVIGIPSGAKGKSADRRVIANELAAASIGGSAYRTSTVDSSWSALLDAGDQISERLRDLIEHRMARVQIDPIANAVIVGVPESASGSAPVIARRTEGVGVNVKIQPVIDERFQKGLLACVNNGIYEKFCGQPLRGGVGIRPSGYGTSPAGFCTAAFRATGKTDGRRYWLTAGHCVKDLNENEVQQWEKVTWGWETWDPITGTGQSIGLLTQWDFPHHDWAKIDVTNTWGDTSPSNTIAYWSRGEQGPVVDEAYAINGIAENQVGNQACHSGIATGTSCGTITRLEKAFNPTEGPEGTIVDTWEVENRQSGDNLCLERGDSGGSVFSNHYALGIVSFGTRGYCASGNLLNYVDIGEAAADLGVTLAPNPSPPPSPTCEGTPLVETGDAPEVRDTEALVTGTVDAHGCSTTFRFEYGMTTSYGRSVPAPDEVAGSGQGAVVVSKFLGDLEKRSHYHYRLVATNSFGTTYGSDRTFTTGVKWLARNSNSSGGADAVAWSGLPGHIHVSGDWDGDGVETPGSYDPRIGIWSLSNSLSRSGKVDISFQYGGGPWSKAVAGDWNGDGIDTIGVYDPQAGNWNLRNSNSNGAPDIAFQYGGGVWKNPVAGDWNGDGIDTIGVYDPQAGNWNLRNSNSNGAPDVSFQFGGGVFSRSIVGDWDGNGTDTIGVHDPQAGNWNLRNSNTTGGPDVSFQYGGPKFGTVVGDWDGNGTTTPALTDADATVERNWQLRNSNSSGTPELGYLFGLPGQIGVVGDWNGDGFQTLGTYNPVDGVWRLTNTNSKQNPDLEFPFGGGPWSVPIVGDWNNDGVDTIGVYDPQAGNWNLRNVNSSGTPEISFQYGGGSWSKAIAGNWDGIGADGIGVYDPQAGNWNLRHCLCGGNPDYSFQYGGGVWQKALAGDWNGDGVDTIGVYDPQAGNWNLRNSNSSGAPNISFQYGGSQFGTVVGDWDGNGTATPGLLANNGEFISAARPPQVTSKPASAIDSGQATLNGTVNPNGFATRYRFEWGATTAYGNSAPVSFAKAGLGTTNLNVASTITGLLGDTTYHYRLVAESAEGKQLGADMTFPTPPDNITGGKLTAMPVVQPFSGSSSSKANFNSNWGSLGWAAGKGEDTTAGWRPVAEYPTVQGAFSNLTFVDEKGIAAAAKMAANPGFTGRSFSLWLGMASPSAATRGGYELRFTYTSSNTYSISLSRWSAGSQTTLATKTGVSFANGNSLALVDKGTSVSGWVDTGAGYVQLLGAVDSTFSSGYAGVQAVGNLTRLANFKVGSILPNTISEPGTSTAWNLRNSNTSGAPDLSFMFGVSGKREVVGDWDGDGRATVGTFDSSTGTWMLRNAHGQGPAEVVLTFGGGSFSTPIVGDWNGDGIDTVGVFDPSARNWSLRNSNLEGPANQAFQYGGASAIPIAGNWDGIGADGIGVYYPSSGNWNLRECVCGGNPDYAFQFGGGVWSKPIAGNWDGIGADGIGVFDPQAGNWNLRHCMCGGNPDYSFQYGGGIWATPLAGDWDANGTDTAGVAND